MGGAQDGLLAAAVFAAGASMGSFLNVVAIRLPRGESVVRPGSHCACGAPIAWKDKLPILSYLLLRGRARCCGSRISARYLWVEAASGLLFLASWLRHPPAVAACGWVFMAFLIPAVLIDARERIIPDAITMGAAACGVLLSVAVPALHGESSPVFALASLRSLTDALAGAAVGSGVAFWIGETAERALGREALGLGDVKLLGAIGAFCGWHGALVALFGGALVGTAWVAAMIVLQRLRGGTGERIGRATEIAFGPMLATAAVLYFLFLQGPVEAWFAGIGEVI